MFVDFGLRHSTSERWVKVPLPITRCHHTADSSLLLISAVRLSAAISNAGNSAVTAIFATLTVDTKKLHDTSIPEYHNPHGIRCLGACWAFEYSPRRCRRVANSFP